MEDVHWLVPTLAATSCWALSDVCCDYAIAGGDDDDAPPPPDASPQMKSQEKGDEQLTPEQNAVVSASVAAAAGLSLFAYQLKQKGATQTLCHGDLRGDNIFWDETKDEWMCIDYQLMSSAPVPADLAYLMSSASVELPHPMCRTSMSFLHSIFCKNGLTVSQPPYHSKVPPLVSLYRCSQ